MAKPSSSLLERAKREAEVQLRDLLHEARLLIELFPHLRDHVDRDELPLNFLIAQRSGALTKRGQKRKVSAPASPAKTGPAARKRKTGAARKSERD